MFSSDRGTAPVEVGPLHEDAAKLASIKRICGLGKLSAESFAGRSDREMLDEMKKFDLRRYKVLLGEAIKLTREINDEFYRASALHQIIDLLLAAGYDELARSLFDTIDVPIVKQSLLAQHPHLGRRSFGDVARSR